MGAQEARGKRQVASGKRHPVSQTGGATHTRREGPCRVGACVRPVRGGGAAGPRARARAMGLARPARKATPALCLAGAQTLGPWQASRAPARAGGASATCRHKRELDAARPPAAARRRRLLGADRLLLLARLPAGGAAAVWRCCRHSCFFCLAGLACRRRPCRFAPGYEPINGH